MTGRALIVAPSSELPARPAEHRTLGDTPLGDLRFRALLGEAGWALLPAPIRKRFSKRLADGRTVVYVGQILEAKASRAGRWLIQAARLIGGPLPVGADVGVPSAVTVTEDMTTGGQIWTRLYARRDGFPQIIHSSKRFAGPTGLEEYIGYGIGMALTVHAEANALLFRSAGYFVQLFGKRFTLPSWLTPGALTVTHSEIGEGRFGFSLEIDHPRLGRLVRQYGVFRETET